MSRLSPPRRRTVGAAPVTVLVPAYNEEETIGETIRSLRQQTVRISEIVVIDDCSTDGTSAVAKALGATVLVPPKNTGSKAGAQNFALRCVRTPYTIAIDADTALAPDAVARILGAFRTTGVVAACGFVLPRYVKTVWERGRYVEYLLAFTFYKQVQEYYRRPLISSGCFSCYDTAVLRACGGWQTRTMAEDMDLTWTIYHAGHGVRFVPEAVCYPIEPHDYHFLSKQLRRWSHGFLQNVRVHWKNLMRDTFLRSTVLVALWDAVFASLAYLLLLPLLSILVSRLFLLAYVFDLPVILAPALVAAWPRRELRLACASIPAFLVLRVVNAIFLSRALISEFLLHRSLTVYEKGH